MLGTTFALLCLTMVVQADSSAFINVDDGGAYRPQPAMLPTIHWETPTDALHILLPSNASSLYFTPMGDANETMTHDFAHVGTNNSYPTVVLMHSQYIENVTCTKSNDSITVAAPNATAYEFLSTHWPSAAPFVAATLSESCGDSTEQHSFFLVTNITLDSNARSLNLTYSEELDIARTFTEIEVSWGKYEPSHILRRQATPSSPSNAVAASGSPKPYTTQQPGVSGAASGVSSSPSGLSSNVALNTVCGAASASLIDGLSTATCGSPTFDRDLDAAIGYYSFSQSTYSNSLKAFAPGLSDYAPADNKDFGPVLQKRRARFAHLHRRSFFGSISNAFHAAENTVVNTAENAVAGVAAAASNVANNAANAVNGAVNVLSSGAAAVSSFAGQITTAVSDELALTPQASTTIPINLGPTQDAPNSPFGAAKLLYNVSRDTANGNGNAYFNVYCVGCKVSGSLQLYGMARYTIQDGLVSAAAGVNGNVAAGIQIGLDAGASYAQNFRKSIMSVAAPPGFSVPKIFVIGPILSLDVEAEVSANAQAQLLAGATVSIPNIAINMDLVDGSKSSASFQPQFQRVFQISGSVQAEASLGVPIGIALGIEIPPINFRKTAGIYDKPYAGASVLASGANQAAGGPTGPCGNGITYNYQIGNQIYVDVFGYTKYLLDSPISSGGQCYQKGASATGGNRRRDIDTLSDLSKPMESNTSFPFSYITGTNPNSTLNIPNFANLSVQALAYADLLNVAGSSGAVNASSGAFGVTTQDGPASLVSISDISNIFTFAADALSGNIYLLNRSTAGNASYFTQTEPGGPVVADATAIDYAHYHPSTMAKYNVSRIRFSNYTAIPKDSDFIGLVPVSTSSAAGSPRRYVAFDTQTGGPFLPVTCEYQNVTVPAKVFLVNANSLNASLTKLLDPQLRNTVTGGVVKQCFYIPMLAR